MLSSHGPSAVRAGSMHSHAALLHLNPDPNPIIHTRSPFLIRPLASVYASSYHTELLDVFPNRCSAILDASTSSSDSPRLRCSSSITARPPAWMQKCSNAVRKSGRYGFTRRFSTRRAMKDTANSSCSDAGSTSGPMAVMLALSASPAMVIRSLDRLIPRWPSPSSSWKTHRYALSWAPVSVRTTRASRNRARARDVDSSTAAPPIRKRQLGSSMARSLPT
ncbi:hypothetical protein SETIT_4G116300v2 [Setaria italica]|uniref:Uncharacterized protein n=1 Tax=Setaria italica TaxID=4555 RepID=A0A368QTL6_SETIT|nr:hypothetical protein SETIT_4G116300v2 [Setaria italica]